MVCSHNQGRSVPAEAIGNKYLGSLGVEDYSVISSGSMVDEINAIMQKQISMHNDEARWCVSEGLKRGIYGNQQKYVAAFLRLNKLSEYGFSQLQEMAHMASVIFVREEHEYRARAFAELELGQPKDSHDQTVVRADVDLILCMGKNNLIVVNSLYARREHNSHGFSPIIDTLKGYATGVPGDVFDAPFGRGYEDYLRMVVEDLQVLVPKAIDRFLKAKEIR